MAKQPGDDECAPLTFKVAEMLWKRAHGWSYDKIGEDHGIKGVTVRDYHLHKARTMLGVDSEAEAIAKAVELGIFDMSVRPAEPRRCVVGE